MGHKGRGKHLTEPALDEIARASDLPLPLRLPMPQDRRLQRVVAAVLSAHQSNRSLEDLAAAAGASSRTLARLFRTETGLSVRQ